MTGNETPDAESSLTEELAAARQQRDAALTRLHHLEGSPSYRVGRAATWLPRALRSLRRSTPRPTRSSVTAAVASAATRSEVPRAVRIWTPVARVEHPDVSVVIPVYNSAPWLDDCLASVLAQSGVTIEVICVNDGSTDDTAEVLRRFADLDERMQVINQPNSGQSVARNRGLDAATGRYVIYLDSDDFWQADTLARLVRHADESQLDLLLFDSFAFRDGDVADATWEWYASYYQRSQEYGEVRPGLRMLADMRQRRDYRPHVGLYVARRSFVSDAGSRFIPGIVHQDNPYTFSLLLHAERVAHVRLDFYARRVRPGSTITSLDDLRSAKGYYLSYVAMMRELGSRQLSPEVAGMVADVVNGVFQGAQQKIASLPAKDISALADLDPCIDAQLVIRALQPTRSRSSR